MDLEEPEDKQIAPNFGFEYKEHVKCGKCYSHDMTIKRNLNQCQTCQLIWCQMCNRDHMNLDFFQHDEDGFRK